MTKVAQCNSCGAQVRFDTDKVNLYEFENNIVTGLIVCPICKQLVEVSRVDRNKEEYNK